MNSRADFSISQLASGDRADPEAVAVQFGERHRTYGELQIAANRVAAGLVASGLERGQRVCFLGRNGIECLEILLGASKAGVVPTFINWRLQASEIALLVEDAEAQLVFVDDAFAETFEAAAAQLDRKPQAIVFSLDSISSTYSRWRDQFDSRFKNVREHPDDTAVQLYTSGTTGRPKGAMLTRANFAVAIPDTADFWGLRPESVVLSVLPMFHIAGIGTAMGTLWAGGRIIIDNDASPETTLSNIAEHGISHLVLASVMLQALVSSPAFSTTDVSTLQTISYGAAPIGVNTLQQIIQRVNCSIVQPYGLTETTGILTLLDDADHRSFAADPTLTHRLGSCGRARPGVEIRIVDPASKVELGCGESGELLARSERVMAGYWNLPDATSQSLLKEGWFRTGDVASIDEDGYVTLRDRLNDVIISGGENVYPVEVESVLHGHAQVCEVAVVGVPHEKWGETPVAVVVPADGSHPESTELIRYTRKRLAHFKCPTAIYFVSELPRNATGKVLRKQLREDTSWRS